MWPKTTVPFITIRASGQPELSEAVVPPVVAADLVGPLQWWLALGRIEGWLAGCRIVSYLGVAAAIGKDLMELWHLEWPRPSCTTVAGFRGESLECEPCLPGPGNHAGSLLFNVVGSWTPLLVGGSTRHGQAP